MAKKLPWASIWSKFDSIWRDSGRSMDWPDQQAIIEGLVEEELPRRRPAKKGKR